MSDLLKLTAEEEEALRILDKRYEPVRQAAVLTDGVFNSGALIHGPGGCGKSWQIEQALKKAGIPYELMNSRISAPGVFKRWKRNASGIYLAEDVEDMASRDKRCVDLF